MLGVLNMHHVDSPCGGFGFQEPRERKAAIVFQRWSQLGTDYVLGASATIVPEAPWKVALSTVAVSSMARNSIWSVTVSGTNVNEIGTTTAAAYARQSIAATINTGSIDWGTSTFDNTLSTGGQSTVGDQVTFGAFTGSGPSPNGANSFEITGGVTLNAGNLYFAADTAATRTFAVGDTEKVTPTVKVG